MKSINQPLPNRYDVIVLGHEPAAFRAVSYLQSQSRQVLWLTTRNKKTIEGYQFFTRKISKKSPPHSHSGDPFVNDVNVENVENSIAISGGFKEIQRGGSPLGIWDIELENAVYPQTFKSWSSQYLNPQFEFFTPHLIDVDDTGNSVKIKCSPQEKGKDQVFTSKILVVADGPSSWVAKKLYPNRVQTAQEGTLLTYFLKDPIGFSKKPKLILDSKLSLFTAPFGKGLLVQIQSHQVAHPKQLLKYLEKLNFPDCPIGKSQEWKLVESTRVINPGSSIRGEFLMGRGRIIMAGQAAGVSFFPPLIEDVAIQSGLQAGYTAHRQLDTLNKPLLPSYFKRIQKTLNKSCDIWNPFRGFGKHKKENGATLKEIIQFHRWLQNPSRAKSWWGGNLFAILHREILGNYKVAVDYDN